MACTISSGGELFFNTAYRTPYRGIIWWYLEGLYNRVAGTLCASVQALLSVSSFTKGNATVSLYIPKGTILINWHFSRTIRKWQMWVNSSESCSYLIKLSEIFKVIIICSSYLINLTYKSIVHRTAPLNANLTLISIRYALQIVLNNDAIISDANLQGLH